MLPTIGNQTSRKKNPPGSDQLVKEWVDTKKQLQAKTKSAANKITASSLADFNKICKLKEIADFYSNYLLYFAEKLPQERATELFTAEIKQIINHRSYYHKIIDTLEQRPDLISQVDNLIQINEGFIAMNSGKPAKNNVRTKINQLLKTSTSLQEIKQTQIEQVCQLAAAFIKLRQNTLQIFDLVKKWRQFLINLTGNSSKKNKIKIIFPYNNFNCMLLPLYDQFSILSSFLSKELPVNQQDNPFLIIGKQPKRKNQFQQLFRNQINKDTTQYNTFTQQILKQKIIKQDPQAKAKQLQEKIKQKQQLKIKKLKQLKQRQLQKEKEKDKQKKDNKQQRPQVQDKKEQRGTSAIKQNAIVKKSKSLIDIQSILLRHNQKKNKRRQILHDSQLKSQPNEAQVQQNNKTQIQSPKKQKDKKIKLVYGNVKNKDQKNESIIDDTQKNDKNNKIKSILDQKAHLEQQLKQAKLKNKQFQKLIKKMQRGTPVLQMADSKLKIIQQKEDNPKEDQIQNKNEDKAKFHNKVQAVYKSTHTRKPSRLSKGEQDNSVISVQNLMNDKRSLQKQLKQQIRQKNKIQKLLKKSEEQIQKQVQLNQMEKSKLQERIDQLKSNGVKKRLQINNKNEDALKRSKASIISIYSGQQKGVKENPQINLIQSRLTEQKKQRFSLEKQIKDLVKQKTKLQKVIQKTENIISKQKQQYQKNIEKYETKIQKLKQDNDRYKSLNSSINLENTRKKSESLRMYTTTPIKDATQQQKKEAPFKKNQKHIKSANYFKLPPEIKKAKLKQPVITEKDQEEQNNKPKQIIFTKQLNKVQIIQTKKTIEIIYQSGSRSKLKKDKKLDQQKQKQDDTKKRDEQLQKVKKDKQILLYQLQREQMRKEKQGKAAQRKMIRQDGQIQRYKEIIQRQKQKKYELQNKIKNLKKQLYDEFDERLKNQKIKFHQQKRQLLAMIQNQKGQKQLKQKYLNNQIKFLKQMEANQNELIKLLQVEKKKRVQKQKQLEAQISKKEELLQIIQIEQIKKGLESEIRKQLQNDNEDESQDLNIEQKKDQLKQQIQQMHNQRNAQLQEIDQQNQKLKALIMRIKDQQSRLISAIKQNIEQQDENQNEQQQQMITDNQNAKQIQTVQKANTKSQLKLIGNSSILKSSKISKVSQSQDEPQNIKIDLQETQRIFKSRLRAQQQYQQNKKSNLKSIRESSEYKSKQEVQNLIQMYLQNPHSYPPPKNRDYSPEQKHQIKEDVLKKSKLADEFQRDLMQLKEVQTFVPTSDDDMMTSHLLNLKRVYQNQQSSALKQQLFPSIQNNQEQYQNDLSFQSEETPPPKTLRDHVEIHAKNFNMKKNNNNKNFLAVNKMRVVMLEQNRKQKEKQFIQQQSKRKAQQQVLKQHFRAMEEERYKKSLQKKKIQQQKLQKLQQTKKNKQKNKNKLIQNRNIIKEDQATQIKIINTDSNIKQKQYKKQNEQIKKEKNKQKQKDVIGVEQKQDKQNQDQDEYEQQFEQQDKQSEENQGQKGEQLNDEQLNEINTQNMEITNKHSSLDRQKKELQKDVYDFQDQIRSYISNEQRFDIYQQFIDSNETTNYILNIQNISSPQIKGLNNNSTILKDIPTYKSVLILIAKDKSKGMEIGIGIFHKQESDSLYVCDYVIAHNMRHFLNLLFNFTRYILKIDVFTNKIQYFFDLSKLEDQISIIHFIEFQQKCKRLGEVYVKVGSDKTRKYVLRRNLFEPNEQQITRQTKGIQFETTLQIHSDYIKQRGMGFKNTKAIQLFSTTGLLSVYLRKNQEKLETFRKNTEDDLKYRQLLVTALLFQKNQIQIKNCLAKQLNMQERLEIAKKLHDSFAIEDPTHEVQQLKFAVIHQMPEKAKRCTLQVENEQINYIIHYPQQAITKIQANNSSQTGIFLGIVPKYKIFIIEASQFIEMNKINHEINVFFYIKHFIKNISEVTKEQHSKVFIPETSEQSQAFMSDLSEKMKASVFAKQKVEFGWKNQFNNSIVFTPTHRDLVIKKPFIIGLLSATVERVVEGTPLCATVVL